MTTALSQNSVLFSAIYKRCTAVAIKTRDEGRGNYPTFLFCLFLNKFYIFSFFFLTERKEFQRTTGRHPFFFSCVCLLFRQAEENACTTHNPNNSTSLTLRTFIIFEEKFFLSLQQLNVGPSRTQTHTVDFFFLSPGDGNTIRPDDVREKKKGKKEKSAVDSKRFRSWPLKTERFDKLIGNIHDDRRETLDTK